MKVYTSKSHKKILYVFVAFFITYFISLLLFIVKPTLFYYRAWEYFDEMGYHVPKKNIWQGYETGDMARRYIYSFQKYWPTRVSVDEEGFRSVPFPSNSFPIVIFGDSHTWGSGLSDEETIPWQVALQLQTPVFNGGRLPFTLSKMIQNPRLKESKIIVELVAQHLISKNVFAHDDFNTTEHEVYAHEKSWKHYFKVHPKRFFIPLKILRNLNLTTNIFNELTRFKVDSFIIPYKKKYTYALKENDLETAIDNICNRSKTLKAQGYQYIFALVPSKVLQLGHQIDRRDIAQEMVLANALKEREVDYLDLCSLFRNVDAQVLYLTTDSHINPMGAKIIADTLTHYIQDNYSNLIYNLKSE
jgi:hypothetical protein